jgi:hypothetical protein
VYSNDIFIMASVHGQARVFFIQSTGHPQDENTEMPGAWSGAKDTGVSNGNMGRPMEGWWSSRHHRYPPDVVRTSYRCVLYVC